MQKRAASGRPVSTIWKTFDSGRPSFEDVRSDAELSAILAFNRSTWPERIREFQAMRTEAEGMD